MGLESLKSVFGDINKNNLDRPKPTNQSAGQQDEAPVDALVESQTDWTIFNDLLTNTINTPLKASGDVIKIEPIDKKAFPSPMTILAEDDSVLFNPAIRSNTGKIKRKADLFQNLGINNKLGEGDLIRETLYNNNHTAVEKRENIKIRPPTGNWWDSTSNGVSGTVYTNRSGMGSLANLDIMNYSSNKLMNYRGLNRGEEPFIVNEIGSKYLSRGANRDIKPWAVFAEDVSRFWDWSTSPAGAASLVRENALAKIGIFDSTSFYLGKNPKEFAAEVGQKIKDTFIRFPSPNVGQSGFLAQGWGMNSRFDVDWNKRIDYSRKFTRFPKAGAAGLGAPENPLGGHKPFKNMGDFIKKIPGVKQVGSGINKLKDKIKNTHKHIVLRSDMRAAHGDATRLDVLRLKWNAAYKTQQAEHATKVLLETERRVGAGVGKIPNPSPFIAPHSGEYTTYKDKISLLDGNVQEDKDDEVAPAGEGDFYVKIKDLRTGIILYFRGYVTGITENVSPSWSPTSYIGRSEDVHIYQKAERDLSFNLKLYPANSTEMTTMYEKLSALTSLAYPNYLPESEGLVRMQPPLTELYMAHIGDRKQGQFGYIKSLSYTVDDTGDWDAQTNLPRLISVAISYQILNKQAPSATSGFYHGVTSTS